MLYEIFEDHMSRGVKDLSKKKRGQMVVWVIVWKDTCTVFDM